MHVLSIVCLAGALFVAVLAVIYQRRDMVPGYGSTMGGDMAAHGIWAAASLLCALGSIEFVRWYLSILVFIVVLGLSFLVRSVVERIPKKPADGAPTRR